MKINLNLTGHLLLPSLSWAGVDRHITLRSSVLLSQKVGDYFTYDKSKQGRSKFYVEVRV